MIDCSKTENYLKEKVRMTKFEDGSCGIKCADCPLSSSNNEKELFCDNFQLLYPKEAIAIVQKWSDEHTIKTYKDDFFEKYPNATKCLDGVPNFCRDNLYGLNTRCSDKTCFECWNEPFSNS